MKRKILRLCSMNIHQGASVCLVMPVYNEEVCILDVLSKWSQQFDRMGLSYTMVVINDGSTDGSLAALENFQKQNPRLYILNKENEGHGKAIMAGYHQALIFHPQWIFQTDSDDQFEPSDFEKLWENRKSSPFLVGIRAQRQDPFKRKVISRILKSVLAYLFETSIKDANTPFRLIRSDFLRNSLSVLPPDLFAPNIFLSVISSIRLKSFPEYPVKHQKRLSGKPSLISWGLIKACFRSLSQVISFKLSLYERINSLDNIEKSTNLDKVA